MNAFAGVGLKYPVAEKFAVEMNISMTPSFDFFDLDYGTAGFIKSGLKVTYAPGKSSQKSKEQNASE